jgi:hypothetical protein
MNVVELHVRPAQLWYNTPIRRYDVHTGST